MSLAFLRPVGSSPFAWPDLCKGSRVNRTHCQGSTNYGPLDLSAMLQLLFISQRSDTAQVHCQELLPVRHFIPKHESQHVKSSLRRNYNLKTYHYNFITYNFICPNKNIMDC